MLTAVALGVAAFLAGFIDSVAGGGGLITLPALLVAGLPSHLALGTNKVISVLGTFAATINFMRSRLILWRPALVGIPFALVGSIVGGKSILYFDSATAGKIVLALLPVAALAVLIPRKAVTATLELSPGALYGAVPLLCFAVGFYDGFFGPGTGTFYILAFHMGLRVDWVRASGTAKTFNLASNVGACAVFVYNGQVDATLGLPLALLSIVGNLLGSQMAIRIGGKLVRRCLLLSLAILFLTLLWRFYGQG